VGIHWGDDCSAGSLWAQWHKHYDAFIMRYATLAAELNVSRLSKGAPRLAWNLQHAKKSQTHACIADK
jgi:hypothetical protein